MTMTLAPLVYGWSYQLTTTASAGYPGGGRRAGLFADSLPTGLCWLLCAVLAGLLPELLICLLSEQELDGRKGEEKKH